MASDTARVATSLFPHANDKGGQSGVDRDRINEIIMEVSGNSPYAKEKIEQRNQALKWVAKATKSLETFDGTRRSVARHHIARSAEKLERTREASMRLTKSINQNVANSMQFISRSCRTQDRTGLLSD